MNGREADGEEERPWSPGKARDNLSYACWMVAEGGFLSVFVTRGQQSLRQLSREIDEI